MFPRRESLLKITFQHLEAGMWCGLRIWAWWGESFILRAAGRRTHCLTGGPSWWDFMFYSSSEGMYDGRQLEPIRADRPRPMAVTLNPNLVKVSKSSDSQITHTHVVWCPLKRGSVSRSVETWINLCSRKAHQCPKPFFSLLLSVGFLSNYRDPNDFCRDWTNLFPSWGMSKNFGLPGSSSIKHMPPLSSQNILFMLLQQRWWRCSVIYLFACLLSSRKTGSTLWQETYPRMNNSCRLLDIQYELGMVLRL